MCLAPIADSLAIFQSGPQAGAARAGKNNLLPWSGSFAGYYFDNPATLFYIMVTFIFNASNCWICPNFNESIRKSGPGSLNKGQTLFRRAKTLRSGFKISDQVQRQGAGRSRKRSIHMGMWAFIGGLQRSHWALDGVLIPLLDRKNHVYQAVRSFYGDQHGFRKKIHGHLRNVLS